MTGIWDRSRVHADSIAGEPHPVGHLRTFKLPSNGDIVPTHLAIGCHNVAFAIKNSTPEIGFFVGRLFLNFKLTNRCGEFMNSGGDGGPTHLLPTFVQGGLLGIKVDFDGGLARDAIAIPFKQWGRRERCRWRRRWCRFLPIPLTCAGAQGERDCAEEDGSDRLDEGIHGMLGGRGALRRLRTRHVIRWPNLPKKSDCWRTSTAKAGPLA